MRQQIYLLYNRAFAFRNGTLEHEDIFKDVGFRDLRFAFKDCRLQHEDIFMEVPPFQFPLPQVTTWKLLGSLLTEKENENEIRTQVAYFFVYIWPQQNV